MKYPIIHRHNGKFHNVTGPAFIHRPDAWDWWMHGKRHRYYGPSMKIINSHIGNRFVWVIRDKTIKVVMIDDENNQTRRKHKSR